MEHGMGKIDIPRLDRVNPRPYAKYHITSDLLFATGHSISAYGCRNA
jgi:hypothetical protein